MIAMAGELAQRRFSPRSVRSYHANGDRSAAMDCLERYADWPDAPDEPIDLSAHWNLLEHWTARLLERKWYLVEAIANALLKNRTLSRNDIRDVIVAAENARYEYLCSLRKGKTL